MKRNSTYVLFGAIFAVAASGILGSNLLSATPLDNVATSGHDGMKMYGHVTIAVKAPDGTVKAYRQTDNLITDDGANCVGKLLFGGGSTGGRGTASAAATGPVCVGALTAPFNYIGTGSGTTAADKSQAKLVTENNANGLTRQIGTITYTNDTASGASSAVQTIAIAKTFSVTGAGGNVAEAGLFNDTFANAATSGMFARQTFSNIALASGDSLAVTWTISIT